MARANAVPRSAWFERIKHCQASGKSAKDWCMENNITYSLFVRWRWRFNKSQSQIATPTFVELKDDNASGLEVSCNNLSIKISKGFDEATLLRFLKLLKSC
jgi:hypothetical protein